MTSLRSAAAQLLRAPMQGPSRWWAAPADPAHPGGATNGQIVMMGDAHHPACHHYELGACTCSHLYTAAETAGKPKHEADRIRVAWALRGACESPLEADYAAALGRALAHWPGDDGLLMQTAVTAAIGAHRPGTTRPEPICSDHPDFHGVHQTLYAINNALVYALGDLDRRWEMTDAVEALIRRR